jgi:hypothetical protein
MRCEAEALQDYDNKLECAYAQIANLTDENAELQNRYGRVRRFG